LQYFSLKLLERGFNLFSESLNPFGQVAFFSSLNEFALGGDAEVICRIVLE
jgi:hypothetical protein